MVKKTFMIMFFAGGLCSIGSLQAAPSIMRQAEGVAEVNLYFGESAQVSSRGSIQEQIGSIRSAPSLMIRSRDLQKAIDALESLSKGQSLAECNMEAGFDGIFEISWVDGRQQQYLVVNVSLFDRKSEKCYMAPEWVTKASGL